MYAILEGYYDNPVHRKNGEFDVALEFADGYEICEAKYYAQPMTLDEIHREVQQAEAIKELTVKQIGFISCLMPRLTGRGRYIATYQN